MRTAFRLAASALLLLPLLSQAQVRSVGLEIPAPAPPSQGHFLAGAYVLGNYAPLATAAGYGVQPYLRYDLGTSANGRRLPYVQYNFAPYAVPAYGAGPSYGPAGTPLLRDPGFAPLGLQNPPAYGRAPYGSVGGLGSFSVGIPMQIGRGTAVLNLGGSFLESAFMNSLRPLH